MRMAATAAVYSRLHNNSVGVGAGNGGCPGGGSSIGSHHHQLARSLERILEEAHFSGELILTNRKLKDFPKTSTKYILTDTVIADLSRNRFCELPEEITTFVFLETLLLYHNTIRSISESIKHLTSLTYLDLRSNQLSTLPRELCFLPLQVLLVSNNRLVALPDELGRMDRLTDLDVSYNQLTSLPARIGELRSLRSFSLRSNHLTYLPRELTCLTLISLDISNNRISSLPLEIRQMTTLVELSLENNPLTLPPASLCIRGLVHVFKYLDTQAAKDEKGLRAGGNYDGYTTLRRAPRYHGNGNSNILETIRMPRHQIDSGYNTSDGIDKRWSHDMPLKTKHESTLRLPASTIAPCKSSLLSADSMEDSLTSSTSTIVDESIIQPTNNMGSSAIDKGNKLHLPLKKETVESEQSSMLNYGGHLGQYISSSSNASSPDLDLKQSPQHVSCKLDDKSRNLGNVQTYREYKEALKQQRIQEVYRIKEHKCPGDLANEQANNLIIMNNKKQQQFFSHEMEKRLINNHNNNKDNSIVKQNVPIVPKSIMKTNINTSPNGLAGAFGGGTAGISQDNDVAVFVTPKKPVQKVTPSRHSDLTAKAENKQEVLPNEKLCAIITNNQTNGINNGVEDADCISYVKPNSPMKSSNSNAEEGIAALIDTSNTVTGVGVGILTNNNKFTIKSPIGGNMPTRAITNGKMQRNVTWNRDIGPEKLSFTMRREFDRQREEIELISQLRNIIESRLKMTLPDDMPSALMDGVILCHLANYVRPRSVASIHVPSPGVSKLTMARCRRNVDNFLEACRKIGVDEELICSCTDIIRSPDGIDTNDDDDNDDEDDFAYNNTSIALNQYLNNNNKINYNNNNDYYVNDNEKKSALLSATIHLKNTHYKSMGNIIAVLKTVAALISLDSNPHHRNIKNLQQQHELHIRLQKYEREHKIQNNNHQQKQQHQHVSLKTLKQRKCENSYKALQTAIASINSNVTKHYDAKLEGLDEEDVELNAERKEYDVMDDDVGDNVYDDEGNAELANVTTNYSSEHDEHVTATGTKEQMIKRMSNRLFYNGNGFSENSENHSENTHNCLDNVVTDVGVKEKLRSIGDHDEVDGKVKFYRHAALKTFQKIKLNLITAHGNNYHMGAAAFGANNIIKMAETLPAIVETENDTCATPSQTNNEDRSELIQCNTHFVNEIVEKTKSDFKVAICSGTSSSNTTNNNNNSLAMHLHTHNKYKLLELPMEKSNSVISAPVTSSSITKRIEFFEHANIPNGGIIQPKANVYSIYRVNELVEDEKLVKQLMKNKKLNAASFFLRHDSQNLICCAADVLEGKGAVQVAITVGELFRLYTIVQQQQQQKNATTKSPTKPSTAARPSALSLSPIF